MKFLLGLIIGAVAALGVIYQESSEIDLKALGQTVADKITSMAHNELAQADQLLTETSSLPVIEKSNRESPDEGLPDKDLFSKDLFTKDFLTKDLFTKDLLSNDLLSKNMAIKVEPPPVTLEFQTAWIFFRSEASATGFANKLSSQLERQFEVVKSAPGHYQVGFRFSTIEDRNAVLASIENMTGYRVPTNSPVVGAETNG